MNGDFVTYRDGRSVNDVLSDLIQGGGGGVGPQGPPGPQGPQGPPGPQGPKGDSGTGCFVAEYNVTTAQEIIDFLESTDNPIAPMLVERNGAFYTVVTAQKMAENKVIIRTFATMSGSYYMFMYTITGSTWASSNTGFQALLVSGTNIKTVNGNTLLGSGDLSV